MEETSTPSVSAEADRSSEDNVSLLRIMIVPMAVTIIFIGLTLLQIAAFYQNTPPIWRAIQWGDLDTLERIITQGENVNAKLGRQTVLTATIQYMDWAMNPLRGLPEDKRLQELARRNRVRMTMATLLIDHGADINALDGEGKALLHYAITELMWTESIVEFVSFCLKSGADSNLKIGEDADKYEVGETPLHLAIHEPEVVKVLLAAGANPNLMNKKGQTALKLAILKSSDDVADILRAHAPNTQ